MISCLNDYVFRHLNINQRSYYNLPIFQDFEADFLWKVSLKIMNSGLIMKTFTHVIHGINRGVPNHVIK